MKHGNGGWEQILRNEEGFTLLEVMTAGFLVTVLLWFLFAGISYTSRVQLRIRSLEQAGTRVEEDFTDKSNFISGSVSLQLGDGIVMEKDGWLYDGKGAEEKSVDVAYILTEEWCTYCSEEEVEIP